MARTGQARTHTRNTGETRGTWVAIGGPALARQWTEEKGRATGEPPEAGANYKTRATPGLVRTPAKPRAW